VLWGFRAGSPVGEPAEPWPGPNTPDWQEESWPA